MADLIAYQDGNWTGATTWKGVVTSTGAKQSNTSGSDSATTSYVYSPTFTVTNGVVVEGLLLFCRRISTSGTVSVALSDDNGTTATREVTVNATDLPASNAWVFFKFGTPLTGDGGTDYRIGIKSSASFIANFSRSAGANDWARYLRTNTTATIATTDVTFICDELTGAGTKNDITVTMDSTASTAYGECNIGQGGVLSYGTSASTNYILDLGGNLNVWGGGTLNIGTSGTPMPSTSTAVLEFTMGTNVLYGLEVRSGGTCNIYGATKSGTQALLTADANSGQAVINVTSTTGWAANDVIALASTTRTASQSEKATVQTVNSGTQATLTANLVNTHHGTGLYVGEVVNLTRNVKIRGTSQTLCAYVNCADTSSFTASYAEFYWLGSATASKLGITAATTSAGTFSVSFCSFYDYFASGNMVALSLSGTTQSAIVEDSVWFLGSSGFPISINNATTGTPSIQRNYVISQGAGCSFSDLGGTIKDNRFGGCGVTFSETGATIGTIKDNVQHSASTGITVGADCTGDIEGLTVWRNLLAGIVPTGFGCTILNSSFYHNADNVVLNTTNVSRKSCIFKACSFDGGSGAGLSQTSNQVYVSGISLVFDSCYFGIAQTTSNFLSLIGNAALYDITFIKCAIGGTANVLFQSKLSDTQEFQSSIKFDKFNNTSGSHRVYKQYGYTSSEQTTFKTSAPSEALIPNTAGSKLSSSYKRFPLASGTSATVGVYVNKSANYNGNQPRLIVKANSIGGIASNTVLATASGGTDSWLFLSGTTGAAADDCVIEVYVDCDGTAGTVYVDDWSVS